MLNDVRKMHHCSRFGMEFRSGLVVGIRILEVVRETHRTREFKACRGIEIGHCGRRIDDPAVEADVDGIAEFPLPDRHVDEVPKRVVQVSVMPPQRRPENRIAKGPVVTIGVAFDATPPGNESRLRRYLPPKGVVREKARLPPSISVIHHPQRRWQGDIGIGIDAARQSRRPPFQNRYLRCPV